MWEPPGPVSPLPLEPCRGRPSRDGGRANHQVRWGGSLRCAWQLAWLTTACSRHRFGSSAPCTCPTPCLRPACFRRCNPDHSAQCNSAGLLPPRCDAHVMATNSPCNHNLAVHARQLPYRCQRGAGVRVGWAQQGSSAQQEACRLGWDGCSPLPVGQQHITCLACRLRSVPAWAVPTPPLSPPLPGPTPWAS